LRYIAFRRYAAFAGNAIRRYNKPRPGPFPILGLIFLPFTTLFYVLVFNALGQYNIWGWLLILVGFLLDLRNYSDINSSRQ